MKVLITGAGGFIGSHLVDRCKADGHRVTGVDRKSLDRWSRGDAPADRELRLDVVYRERMSVVEPFDLCYHLAAESRIQPSFSDSMGFVRNNVVGTANVLDLCHRNGAAVVYAGSSTADDDVSKNVYATTKRAGEDLCRVWSRCFGLRTMVTRFYNVYGPRQVEEGGYATVIGIWEWQLREGSPLTVTGSGGQRRDFTHVDDIVEGLVAVAGLFGGKWTDDAPCGFYSLGSGRNHSLLAAARLFSPNGELRFVPRPPGEAEVTLADLTPVMRDTEWRPGCLLEDYAAGVVWKIKQRER